MEESFETAKHHYRRQDTSVGYTPVQRPTLSIASTGQANLEVGRREVTRFMLRGLYRVKQADRIFATNDNPTHRRETAFFAGSFLAFAF